MFSKDIDIEEINIIVRKTEKDDLNYKNPDREGDGFVALYSGKGYAKDENNNVYCITEGDIVILKKHQKYAIYLEKGSTYITSAYQLSEKIETSFSIELPFVLKCSHKHLAKIEELANVWQSRTWDSYTKCRIILLEFYLEIIRMQIYCSKTDRDINNAIKFIHQNFKKNFSGKEIAEYCSISLSHLRSKFLKQTGITITQYRDNLRIENAEEMIRSNNFTITEIALELGYCDVYHFSKTFKKIKGISPTNMFNRKVRKI